MVGLRVCVGAIVNVATSSTVGEVDGVAVHISVLGGSDVSVTVFMLVGTIVGADAGTHPVRTTTNMKTRNIRPVIG